LRLVVLYTVLLPLAAFSCVPFVLVFSNSVKTESELYSVPPIILPSFPVIDNYFRSLFDKKFLVYLGNSVIVSAMTVAITLLISIPSAYGLARFRFKGREIASTMVLLAYLMPQVVLLVPLFILFKNLQLLGTYFSMIIAYLIITVPLSTWFLRGYFIYLPWELEEAALVDGCSRLSAIFRVILPMAAPGLAAVIIFTFITSWQEFLYALVFSSSRTMTGSVAIASYLGEYGIDWGPLSASTVMFSLPMMLLFVMAQRYFAAGLAAGAVKG
jgi:ABC-type glycerol-3-phosphate transport system permease component